MAQPEPEHLIFLAIQAHPDDVDFSCGGTVAKLVRDGHEVHYCSATSGNKGSHDRSMTPEQSTEIRECEQEEAQHDGGEGGSRHESIVGRWSGPIDSLFEGVSLDLRDLGVALGDAVLRPHLGGLDQPSAEHV